MIKRIFKNNLICSLAAVMATAVLMLAVVYSVFSDNQLSYQKDEALMIARALNQVENNNQYLDSLTGVKARITLIAADGSVLFDNYTDPSEMENHGDRPEFIEAAKTGTGENRRHSVTLGQTTFYHAVKLEDGSVLRLASAEKNVWGLLLGVMQPLLFILLVVALVTFFVTKRSAEKIVQPINELNLVEPLENIAYDELAPLLRRIEKQNKALAQSMKELSRKQREFSAVTENMAEGMIILDSRGSIITINNVAMSIFALEGDCTGKPLVAVSRSFRLKALAEKAQSGRSGEELLELDGRTYQLLASPVLSKDVIKGSVVLILDVTEKITAERDRREFTANVSHELKTPLTSIMGYAEIMKGGLVKPEDTKEFSCRIYDEARRLLSLVEDIMRLSQMDERVNLPQTQSVELLALCRNVAERLKPVAEAAGVKLSVTGVSVEVQGIPKVLDEMVFNLVDNGIKYNVPGGIVEVTVGGGNGSIEVRDTGVGIAKAHQQRVFERFYRVDKSHSKETGGTGLGLSIVKHGAMIHCADIQLTSEEGVGTTIKLLF